MNVGLVACRLTGCRLRGIGLVTVGSLNVGSVTGTLPHQHQRAGPSSKPLHHTVRRPFLINTKEQASPSLSTKAIPHQHQRASFARLPFNDNATDAFKTNILKGMKYENCNVTLCIKCRYNIFTCRGQVV